MTLSSKSMSNHFKRPILAGRIPANAAMHIYNLCTEPGSKSFSVAIIFIGSVGFGSGALYGL